MSGLTSTCLYVSVCYFFSLSIFVCVPVCVSVCDDELSVGGAGKPGKRLLLPLFTQTCHLSQLSQPSRRALTESHTFLHTQHALSCTG